MPTFDGDIRQYPRFKKDFEPQVLPGLPKESEPYALRSCLGREPLSIVRSIEDDIENMLQRFGHRLAECKRKKVCGENGCKGTHHKIIHMERKSGFAAACGDMTNSTCLLQIQRIKTSKGSTNVLCDNAASICLITYSKAKEEKLHSKQVKLSITKVGGIDEKLTSQLYLVPLVNKYGKTVFIEAYGIERITLDIQAVNLDGVVNLFKGVSAEEVTRPTGPVDLLIGYEYAGFHPQLERRNGHLLILKNQFVKCIGGKHPSIKETQPTSELTSSRANHVNAINVEDIYNIVGLWVACSPRCGGCKCGKCPIGSNDCLLKEEREIKLIESKLTFDDEEKKWTAEYPWIRNPKELPDNRRAKMRDTNEEELNNEMEQNSEMEQNNEITSDVEEKQVDEERQHVSQVHESHESREVEETQTLVKVNGEGSRASDRNEIPRRQTKRVVEPSNTTRQIVTQVGEKRKCRPDVQLLSGKRNLFTLYRKYTDLLVSTPTP